LPFIISKQESGSPRCAAIEVQNFGSVFAFR
jgi:hypothetical protein